MGNATSLCTSLCLKYYFILLYKASTTDLAAEYIVNIFSKSEMGFFSSTHINFEKKKFDNQENKKKSSTLMSPMLDALLFHQ